MKTLKTIGLVLPVPVSGSETFFHSKISGLKEEGFKVIVYCVKGPNEAESIDYRYQWPLSKNTLARTFQVLLGLIKLIAFPRRVLRFIKAATILRQSPRVFLTNLYTNGHILAGPKLDAIHFGFTTMGLGRETLGKAMNCKLSTSFRGYDVAIYPIKNGLDCYDTLWRYLDKIHTISDDLLEIAYEKLGLTKNIPVRKVNPAIDTKKFVKTENRQFIKAGKLKILSVGRLHWKKGHEYALVALKKLKEEGVNFEYSIVGSGHDLERITFAKAQLGLDDEVKILGNVSHKDIPRLMRDSDILLHPSVQEGFGNAVLEAQAAGMLCLVSDAEGLAENVLHRKTGWVVPKRNSTMIFKQLLEIINKPEDELLEVSNMARNRVVNQFDLEIQKISFTQFFNTWE